MDKVSKASKGRSIWSGLENKKPENRMRNLPSICLDKGTLEHFTAIFSYLTGEYKGDVETLLRGEQRGDQRQQTQVGTYKFPNEY